MAAMFAVTPIKKADAVFTNLWDELNIIAVFLLCLCGRAGLKRRREVRMAMEIARNAWESPEMLMNSAQLSAGLPA